MKPRQLLICIATYCCLLNTQAWAQQSVADFIYLVEQGQENIDAENSEHSIEQLLARFNLPGVSIAIIRDFEVQWARGYGVADVVSGLAVDTETLFQAASISKPVNAMAVLKSAEEGLFSIDQDINTILTGWRLPDTEFTLSTKVTPRMLASHTAGLGDGFGFPGYEPDQSLPSLQQIFDGLAPSNVGVVRVVRPPMSAFHYSGGGVTILQQALIDTYNNSYADLMEELVLAPIGMVHSTFEQPLPASRDANAARAHSRTGQANGPKWHIYPEQAAAGLWTTPTDLARFAIEVQLSYQNRSNKVLSKESITEMLSPVGVGSYGIGFSLDKRGEGWYFSHGGGNFGFLCLLVAHKVKGYGFAIMTNASSGGPVISELARRIEAVYRFDSLDAPVPR
ncbi:MAG: serine hydrolase [Proteobacteria bacterium]|nr:serine hydrolase [Pseudomonadota bacterium]